MLAQAAAMMAATNQVRQTDAYREYLQAIKEATRTPDLSEGFTFQGKVYKPPTISVTNNMVYALKNHNNWVHLVNPPSIHGTDTTKIASPKKAGRKRVVVVGSSSKASSLLRKLNSKQIFK